MWPMLALAGGSALLGMDQARQQQKQQKAQNMAAAAQTEFSPWTGMGQGQIQTGAPSTLAAGLQGGLTGFMQGQNIEQGMAKSAPIDEALKKKTLMNPEGSTLGGYSSNTFGALGK